MFCTGKIKSIAAAKAGFLSVWPFHKGSGDWKVNHIVRTTESGTIPSATKRQNPLFAS
jgi:hypothetical protein